MNDTHLTQQAFSGLGLPEPLLAGVLSAGFTHCTPIQAATLPKALAGHDVAGQAQTGTGKTAAFLLAVFNRLLMVPSPADRRPNQPRALILAPTRELAIQIHKDALVLGAGCAQSIQLAYGGTGYESQRKAIEEGVDILIGTPGRLIDYFKQHVFDLRALEVMVLDEADRMFDLGFIKDIRYLLHRMPPVDKRLSLLFSATLSYRVMELAYEHMNNPELVRIEAEKMTAERVRERLYHVAQEEKLPVLVGLLRREQVSRGLVFTNTKHAAERVQGWLEANDFAAAVLSGDVPQQKRQSLLADFQGGHFPILVATDVAARGLHIPDVSHVFNYDLPQDAEDYVHRIGRTARAGAAGEAVSLACDEYAFSLMDIEAYIGHKIPVARVTDDLIVSLRRPAHKAPREHVGHHARTRGESTARDRGHRHSSRRPHEEARGPRRPAPAASPAHTASLAPKPAPSRPAEPRPAEPVRPHGRKAPEKPVLG
ncbi:DEAD/DEAH box helicase [Acidiferrobacter thiooxydans]|uniref:ATP-dependent RNA helicase RhlB n=1 Tax=Acidiferrobacter thiooxydans TaxID=163359 RepID=A0A1C2G281_9GAMM|nr:DEAD/DEAH box helicase [Acidiferrobacter thiooxydans]RCN58292.1 RNA helicase [Acidiferrobacter thiooxydans]UEN99883.1 DEAD/DEAH box helicase [Acidiferrobacter thiooxydans]